MKDHMLRLLFPVFVFLLIVLYLLQCEPSSTTGPDVVIADSLKPTVSFEYVRQKVTRKSGTFSVTAKLDSIVSVKVVVPFTVIGSAQTSQLSNCTNGEFVFNPGEAEKTLTYTIKDNATVNGFQDLVISMGTSAQAKLGEDSVDSVVIACGSIVNFQLADNLIPGWVQSPYPSDLNVAEGEGLYEIINGGATPYISYQYSQALWQVLSNSAVQDQSISLMAMTYPTAALADSIFLMKTLPASPDEESEFTLQLDGYLPANVLGTPTIGGATYIMRFGYTYFELTLSGFASTELAAPVAKTVAGLLVARIQ